MKPRARPGRVSAKLIFSYVLDWVVIILTAVVGAVFSIITPNKRPFSLADPDISFPYVVKEKISTSTLVLCGLVAPGVIIFIVSMIFVPGPTISKSTPKSLIWRRKLVRFLGSKTTLFEPSLVGHTLYGSKHPLTFMPHSPYPVPN
jgi:uncharacterized membrane protein